MSEHNKINRKAKLKQKQQITFDFAWERSEERPVKLYKRGEGHMDKKVRL